MLNNIKFLLFKPKEVINPVQTFCPKVFIWMHGSASGFFFLENKIGAYRVDLMLFVYLLLNLFDCKTSWMFPLNIFVRKIKLTESSWLALEILF